MKIKDIPQVGKYGLSVTWKGRNGLLRRILVTPKNPRTQKQLAVRKLLQQHGRAFTSLTDAQQKAWMVAAASIQSGATLGQSGPLTGVQLYVRVNCKLGLLGLPTVTVPPAAPKFPDVAPTGLVITNEAGVVTLKLTCTDDPGQNTVLRASPPQNGGVWQCGNYRIIGVCPAPQQGAVDITALYTTEFGVVPPGKRIFVQASTMVDGFESLPSLFQARVPAA